MAGSPVRIVQYSLDDVIPSIDSVHGEIHSGHLFSGNHQENLVSAGSVITVLITAPAIDYYHFTAEIDTDGPGILTFSKNPSATATGSSTITFYNHNENSTVTCALVAVANGTYVSSGTVIESHVIGGSSGIGANSVVVGGNSSSRYEWIFAPSSIHLLKWTADLASCRTSITMYTYKKDVGTY